MCLQERLVSERAQTQAPGWLLLELRWIHLQGGAGV